MFTHTTYSDTVRNLCAAWVCADLLARHIPYRRFTRMNADQFSSELAELGFQSNFGGDVAPVRRAIKRAADMAGVAEHDVIVAFAETPQYVILRIADYLTTLANGNMRNVHLSDDIFDGLYGHNKHILQCLIMALLED